MPSENSPTIYSRSVPFVPRDAVAVAISQLESNSTHDRVVRLRLGDIGCKGADRVQVLLIGLGR